MVLNRPLELGLKGLLLNCFTLFFLASMQMELYSFTNMVPNWSFYCCMFMI